MLGSLAMLGCLVLSGWLLIDALKSPEPEGLVIAGSEAGHREQNLTFCRPYLVTGSEFQYIPVAAVSADNDRKNPVLKVASSPFDRGYSSYVRSCGFDYGSSNTRIFNVVVRNTDEGTQRLLLKEPGRVESMEVPAEKCAEGQGNTPCNRIIWTLRRRDTNGDNIINRQDALVAYVSDLSVTELQPVTPDDAMVLSSMWDGRAGELLFQVRFDTNSDGRYTPEDGSEILGADAAGTAAASPLVARETRDKLTAAVQ